MADFAADGAGDAGSDTDLLRSVIRKVTLGLSSDGTKVCTDLDAWAHHFWDVTPEEAAAVQRAFDAAGT